MSSPPHPEEEAAPRGGTARALLAVLGFSTALGATTLVYPLLALEVGFAPAAVGVFTAVSGAAQLVGRFGLPWLLARVPDRSLIASAGVMIAVSAATLMVSTAAATFVLAQVLQGGARALFWTAAQTHAVRASGSPVQRLAQVQIAGNSGTLTGPALAGLVATASFPAALAVTVCGALLSAGAALSMVRRDPYLRGPRSERRPLWWRRDLSLGYWTSFTSGGWRGLLDSFVPVVLSGAGLGAAVVGWLMSTAEGAQLLVGVWLARTRSRGLSGLVRVGAGLILLSVVALPVAARHPLAAAGTLALAGWGAGMTNTLGPALTNHHASPSEQGSALAVSGAYRAAARMGAPAAVATLTPVVGISVAMVLAAGSMVAPVLGFARRARAPGLGAG